MMKITEAVEQKAKFIMASCDPAKERDGMSELWHVLVKYCKITPIDAFSLNVKGLFLIAIKDDLEETFERITQVIMQKKFQFIICKKLTLLEQLIKSDLDRLSEILQVHLQRIPKNVKWRISVNRRHTKLKKNEIIELIANHPNAPEGPVDLENPNWIIQVEIFGEWLGFGLFNYNPIIRIN
ncbi:MAG: hypothetical protein FK732_06500 [Asgard group archaeon]|nr:hypothetical protein [Asgard group archaeon]